VRDRVVREIELVREKHPKLQHGDQLNWVLIPDYPLPSGRFTKVRARLLFLIPVGYPNTGPDNFFVDGDLRLAGGGTPPGMNPGPQSNTGMAPVGDNWAWFSWHPQAWRPAAAIEGGDNLLTFLRSINLCLDGREAT
jgi:hypothetical protein